MRVRFWGTRGSIPTPGPTTVRYGGNTSCVELRSASGTLVVLDCGTGARPLGAALLEEGERTGKPPQGAILIGHTHWDHIQGLPFFSPLFGPGAHFAVYGPRGMGTSLDKTLSGQMQYQYFPISLDQLGATLEYHDLVEGSFEVDDLTVTTQYLNHPALTLGYRIEGDGVSVAYIADHEPFDPELAAGGDLPATGPDARHAEFVEGCDLVIHDTQYDWAEYGPKRGWGHSTAEYALAVARRAGIGELVLFHHDPSCEDDSMDARLERVRRLAGDTGFAGEVTVAAEGSTIEVTPRPAARRLQDGERSGGSAETAPALEDQPRVVVLSVEDKEPARVIAVAATTEGLAVAWDEEVPPAQAIAVVDLDTGNPRVPPAACVLGLTRGAMRTHPGLEVADWLVWPCSEAHIRTKLRKAVLGQACRWLAAPEPLDEKVRLAALAGLGLLDTPPEDRFDRITALACETFAVPIALVSLVDGTRQWFKSRVGLDKAETPRDESVCAHAILQSDVFCVDDLAEDDRFADNPIVTGPDRMRFYAGAPLRLPTGEVAGTLCIIDHRPRHLSDADRAELKRLAVLVEAELAAR